jgi:hypothetical protein
VHPHPFRSGPVAVLSRCTDRQVPQQSRRGCRAWHAGALRPVGARGCMRVNGRGKRSASRAVPGL